ncbi:MAG: small-conductance mechanosensitive channel [Parvicella sp.]|jgi:small-conductance mechanosensitive channel
MEENYTKIIATLIIIVVYILIRTLSNKVINKTMATKLIQKSRGKIIKKAINITLLFVSVTLILIIWGVNQSALAAYIGSILTVVGLAFFAQWSILSNITSSIIIFFNHSVKIGDHITILEGKEYEIEGRVSDIGLFFVTLKTEDNKEISLPNNIFIQKTIKK